MFEDLGLLGNNASDWILGRQHRRISKPFFDIDAATDGPPVGNEFLVNFSSLFLRLMTVASFSEFEAANTNNGVQLMSNKALEGIYHWREVHSATQWRSGTPMTKEEIAVIRASRFPWDR